MTSSRGSNLAYGVFASLDPTALRLLANEQIIALRILEMIRPQHTSVIAYFLDSVAIPPAGEDGESLATFDHVRDGVHQSFHIALQMVT